jgi:hypothetical protein
MSGENQSLQTPSGKKRHSNWLHSKQLIDKRRLHNSNSLLLPPNSGSSNKRSNKLLQQQGSTRMQDFQQAIRLGQKSRWTVGVGCSAWHPDERSHGSPPRQANRSIN